VICVCDKVHLCFKLALLKVNRENQFVPVCLTVQRQCVDSDSECTPKSFTKTNHELHLKHPHLLLWLLTFPCRIHQKTQVLDQEIQWILILEIAYSTLHGHSSKSFVALWAEDFDNLPRTATVRQ